MKRIISVIITLVMLMSIAAVNAHAYVEPVVGDVDGSGLVEIDDATFLQRKLINIPLPFYCEEIAADADEDGFVTILDVTYIQRWLIGLRYHLNIGEQVFRFDLVDSIAESIPEEFKEILYIQRICPTHFFASSNISGTIYKINARLSDEWCVGDEVEVTLANARIDINNFYGDGDLLTIEPYIHYPHEHTVYKPVIYLYPEEETEVSVKLDLDGEFLYTYPEYKDGWTVTASPDGTLTDESGAKHPYLFWEANLNAEYDFSTGFCIKGSDTEAFLRDSLSTMGLNEKEADDFIDFWLRFMQDNPYNVISFQTEAYTDSAKLDITPQPDTTIRVFMTWYTSDEAVEIPAQTLVSTERNGFTAVEWGGQKCG